MKLAIVRQKYTPFGGAERFVERALAALVEQGSDVTLICREWRGGEKGGFPVEVCDPPYAKWRGRKGRDESFCRAVQAVIAAGRFDLVQSHERIPGCHVFRAGDGVHATWLELRARLQNPLQRFATRHHPWHRYTLAAEAAMFRHPDLRAVICNSALVRDDIARRFGVGAEKLHVIHNGVDLGHFHPGLRAAHRAAVRRELAIPGAAPLILFVGSGFERKGVATLLKALARMSRRDAHLAVVGRDRRGRDYERLAGGLGLAGRVRFLGARPDVRPYYGAADAFALPTLYDPFPNAALEALACGLPVATSTTCGAAELIDAGRNGFVGDALDDGALAAALDDLLAPADAEARRAAARASAEALPLDVLAMRLTALYRGLQDAAPRR